MPNIQKIIKNSTNLSDTDREMLNLYYQATNTSTPLTEEERARLSNAMSAIPGDENFASRLANFDVELKKDGMDFGYLDIMRTFTNEMLTLPDTRLIDNLSKGNKPSRAKPLSELDKITKLKRCFEIFDEKGLKLDEKYDTLKSSLGHFKFDTQDTFKAFSDPTTDAITKSKSLNTEDKKMLILYHQANNTSYPLRPEDSKYLSETLSKKFDDKNFNQRISDFSRELKKSGAPFGYLDVIRDISFELPNTHYFDRTIERAQLALSLTSKGQKLEEREKLSIAEIGLMDKVNKLVSRLDVLKSKGIELGPKYDRLREQSAKVNLIQEGVDKLFDRSRYQSGDIMATEMDKTESYKLKHTREDSAFNKEDLLNTVKRRFTKYGHTAQLTKDGEDMKISHMWDTHKVENFKNKDILESEVFRVDATKLVDKAKEIQLQDKLGVDWKKKVQGMYAKAIDDIAQSKLSTEHLDIITGLKAGKSLLPHFVGRKRGEDMGLFSPEGKLNKDEMICSDFVARETVEALRQVNKDLQELGVEKAIMDPFPDSVNMARVHPEELIKLLNKSGCLHKIEQEEVSKVIEVKKNFGFLTDKHEDLTVAIYNKMSDITERSPTEAEFIKNAKDSFASYLEVAGIIPKASDDKELNEFLEKSLSQMHQEYENNKYKGFGSAFCNFVVKCAEYIGIKDKAGEKLLKETVGFVKEYAKLDPTKKHQSIVDRMRNTTSSLATKKDKAIVPPSLPQLKKEPMTRR